MYASVLCILDNGNIKEPDNVTYVYNESLGSSDVTIDHKYKYVRVPWYSYTYVCMYVCVPWYSYTYVCMYVRVPWYSYTYVCMYVRVPWYSYTYVCMYVRVPWYSYTYVRMYVRTCTLVFIYVRMYILLRYITIRKGTERLGPLHGIPRAKPEVSI